MLQEFLNANGGASEVFGSWVSTGANQTITPLQIDPAQASDCLARTLPGLVDQLTPQGQLS